MRETCSHWSDGGGIVKPPDKIGAVAKAILACSRRCAKMAPFRFRGSSQSLRLPTQRRAAQRRHADRGSSASSLHSSRSRLPSRRSSSRRASTSRELGSSGSTRRRHRAGRRHHETVRHAARGEPSAPVAGSPSPDTSRHGSWTLLAAGQLIARGGRVLERGMVVQLQGGATPAKLGACGKPHLQVGRCRQSPL
jgi:hypothetical protein